MPQNFRSGEPNPLPASLCYASFGHICESVVYACMYVCMCVFVCVYVCMCVYESYLYNINITQ